MASIAFKVVLHSALQASRRLLCANLQVDEYVSQHFEFAYSFRGWVVLILLGFIFVLRLGAIGAVTKLSYVKR